VSTRRHMMAVVAVAGIVFGACSGAATTAPSAAPASVAAPASAAASAAASAGASAGASSAPLTGAEAAAFGTNYKPTAGTPGGTLIMGEWQAAAQLNPYYTNSEADVEAILPILRSCATVSADGKFIPDLCSTLPSTTNGGIVISGNTMTMTLHLKPGLQWSDGTPLTMNDFKYTWQWTQDKTQSGCIYCGQTSGFPEVTAIDVSSDGLTATYHFNTLFGGWLGMLTSMWPLQQKYMSTMSVADAAKNSYPFGPGVMKAPSSGPYIITNISSSEIDYAPNPNWHGGVSTPHAPYLQSLKFQYFGDQNGEIAAFVSGNIDVAFDLLNDSYPAIQKVPASIGTASLTPLWEYEHFDLNNDPNNKRGNGMSDLNVRKALAMSVNKQAIIAADFPGQNLTAACSPAAPGEWYRKDETCPSYDPAGAKALLQSSGYSLDSAGYMAKGGKEMNLELCTTSGNPTRLTELQKLSSDLKAIGVKSYIKTAPAASAVFAGWTGTTPTTDCSIYRGNYDIADFAYVETGTPYGDYYFTYASTQWPELGDHSGGNDTRFKSAEMDAALNKLATDVPLDSQLADAQAVQDAYAAGIPEIPLYYRAEAVGVSTHFGNWPGYNPSGTGPTWNVEDWYYKP